jgi:hypothetical protein
MVTVHPPDKHAAAIRAARDHISDILELLGIDNRVELAGDGTGRIAVRLPRLSARDAQALGDALIAGAISRRLLLTPGAPVWSMRRQGVGVVATVSKDHVVLRSLAGDERWLSGPTDIRAATMGEISTATAARDERRRDECGATAL